MNNIGHPENANPEEDSMTFQEKENLVNLGCILLIFMGYCVFLFQMIQNGTLTTTNDLAFWAGVILKLISIQIGANILVMIIFNIILTIIATDRIPEKSDELDKQVDMKSTVYGSYVFFVGFLIAMILAAFGLPAWMIFNMFVASFFGMQFTWSIVHYRMYHRGF
jgi:hypothetical protein